MVKIICLSSKDIKNEIPKSKHSKVQSYERDKLKGKSSKDVISWMKRWSVKTAPKG